jgi:hypothetical protein
MFGQEDSSDVFPYFKKPGIYSTVEEILLFYNWWGTT